MGERVEPPLWMTEIDEAEAGWSARNERIWARLKEVERRLGTGISEGPDPEIAVGFGERQDRLVLGYFIYSQRALDEFRSLGGEEEAGYYPPPEQAREICSPRPEGVP